MDAENPYIIGYSWVELVGRYSKLANPTVLPQFPTLQYGQLEYTGQDRLVPVPRIHAIERRLEADIIKQLVQDYEAGTPSTELTERYELGKGTVLKLLRAHGVTIRRQGLSPAQIQEATALYA
ncbi:MAG TPA: hypothetical protein VGH54_28515, partial [Mycobacterium sp.]